MIRDVKEEAMFKGTQITNLTTHKKGQEVT